MSAGTITLKRGVTKTLTLAFTENGSPLNLTGQTVWFTMKRYVDNDPTNALAVIAKVITSHTNAVGGITQVVILNTDSAPLDNTKYVYDVQVGTSAADRRCSDIGSVEVEGTVKV
jgi:hypothetical protein